MQSRFVEGGKQKSVHGVEDGMYPSIVDSMKDEFVFWKQEGWILF